MATHRKLYNHDMRWRAELGVELLGGVDEAGRGALAGPVVAAVVVLDSTARLKGVNDSKVLKHAEREALVPAILQEARAWAVGWCSAARIDEINILEATLCAAGEALARLAVQPEALLTDFLKLKNPPCRCVPLVDGDALSLAIAAASVLAKVARDRMMIALEAEYPAYGFASHKGYGTEQHWTMLQAHGPSTLHRMTFRGVGPEPFFGEELPVEQGGSGSMAPERRRCASWQALAGRPRPLLDWAGLLRGEEAAVKGELFLPECEWGAHETQTSLVQ